MRFSLKCHNHINVIFITLFMLSMINLLYLHYYFLLTITLEVNCFLTSYCDNLLACIIDVTFIFIIAWLINFGRIRNSLILTFIITLLWSFSNIFYARFFHQYLSWSSIGQVGNLADGSVTSSILAGFQLSDLYYPLISIVFTYICIKSKQHDVKTKSLRSILIIWGIGILLAFSVHSLYFLHPQKSFVYVLEKTMFTPSKMDFMWPNWTVFHKGFFRKLILEQITKETLIELNQNQKEKIEREINNTDQRVTQRTVPTNVKNLIFILVESYLSVTSDLIVDGKEITPYLNKLRHDSAVYYNGHMMPNVSIGESSDGQLIYMTGLLPLHSEITVSKAKKNKLVGLPQLIKKTEPDLTSITIIPTTPSLWDQQAISDAYGFDKLYSMLEYQRDMKDNESGGFLTDEMIFKYASYLDSNNSSPFMSLILTMSMHQPYNSHVEHGFVINDKNLPQEYKNYLINCHYTDIQIGKYLESLKAKGIYENCLIVITSDHDARPRNLSMEGIITPEIPLYIINGGFNPNDAWSGSCNQLDVYTTILDIMGIDSFWHGLGHTLLNKHYENSVNQDIQEISDWIIYGNYFRGQNK